MVEWGREESGNPFGYCGEYCDFETGFIYLRARYYDPTTGRFTSEDTHWNTGNMIYGDEPMGYGEVNRAKKELMGQLLSNPNYTDLIPDLNSILQSGNLYAYCMNNPVNVFDPTGESVIVIFGITISIWEALAAGFTFAFLMDLATQGPLSTAFVEAVQEQGKNIVDALGYAKGVYETRNNQKGLEKGMTKTQKEHFQREIEKHKRQNGRRPNDNLPWEVLVEIAEDVKEMYK